MINIQPGVQLFHDRYRDVLLPLHVCLIKECYTREEEAQSIDEDHGAAGHCVLVSSFLTGTRFPKISQSLGTYQ